MLICGFNEFKQLDTNSNNKNSKGKSIISPPIQYHIDPSSLLSFSTNSNQTVWIFQNGETYITGNNSEYKISGSLPKKALSEDTKLSFNNQLNQPYKFISVVCGVYFTLYLVSAESDPTNLKLIYCYENRLPNPLFLNIGNRKPLSLFGGYYMAAVIDTEGGITVITQSVFDSPTEKIPVSFLPSDDKPIKISFGYTYIMALGQSGKIYQSQINDKSPLEFKEIEDFVGQICRDISGSYDFSLVVLLDGRVFGIGGNWHCKLGFPEKVRSVSTFTEIDSLKEYKIVAAFAGSCHSIFKTSDGRMIVCGFNGNGQLFIEPKEIIFPPEEVKICHGFSFCIAADLSSVAFVGVDPPQNISNKKITEIDVKVDELNFKKALKLDELIIDSKDEENSKLKNENSELKNENSELKNENSELKLMLNEYKKRIEILEKENLELKRIQNQPKYLGESNEIECLTEARKVQFYEISPPNIFSGSNKV